MTKGDYLSDDEIADLARRLRGFCVEFLLNPKNLTLHVGFSRRTLESLAEGERKLVTRAQQTHVLAFIERYREQHRRVPNG